MEVVGLTVGVVALYNICIDILEKIDTFKAIGQETRQLISIFEADKRRFQDWARAVGISDGKLEETHNSQLDDPDVANCVKLILQSICETLGSSEQTQSQLGIRLKDEKSRKLELGYPTEPAMNKLQTNISIRSRAAWTFRRKGKFTNQVETFHKLVEHLFCLVPPSRKCADNASISTSVPTSLQVDLQIIIKETMESARRQALKDADEWLDVVMPDRQFDECIEACLEGTCKWIFTHPMFQMWISGQDLVSKILWINGGAGHGKSILCAKIVQHFQSSDSQPLAHFFSSAHAHAGGNPKDIARFWLSQLARKDSNVLDIIRGHMMGNEGEKRALQVKVWDILEDVLHSKPQQMLILDGLDEYDRTADNRTSFLRILKSKVRRTGARILLVSRDEVDIRCELSQDNDELESLIFFNCQITEKDVHPDIIRFSQQIVDQKIPKKDKSLRQDIAQQMAEKCQGMFLWIKMQQDHLRPGKNQKQLRSIINEMPLGLTNTYERNWRSIQSQNDYERERAFAILRWVVFAVRPLTVSELTDALIVINSDDDNCLQLDDLPETIDDDYINSEIKEICASLVDIKTSEPPDSPGSRIIQLTHFSVKEYLLSVLPNRYTFCNLKQIQDNKLDHHTNLAEICLRYLNCSATWQPPSLLFSENTNRPFIQYASTFWPSHYSIDGISLLAILEKFFHKENLNFQKWCTYFESNYILSEDDAADIKFEPSSPLYYLALFGILPDLKVSDEDMKQTMDQATGRFGSPLSAACSKGHLKAFEWLIASGADVNAQGGQSGSALNEAIANKQDYMIKRLINLGATPNTKDFMGRDPLYIAAMKGMKDIINLLLQHGGEVLTTNIHNLSAVNEASYRGHLGVVQLLLDAGADLSVANNDGWTPLNSACYNGHLQVVQLLLDRGANLLIADNNGITPLNYACYSGYYKIVQLLLDRGADLSVANNNGWTPLYSACYNGHFQVMQLLLDKGADPSVATNSGWTPLFSACHDKHYEIIKLLLNRGADLSVKYTVGYTPLHNACYNGHLQVVQLLLDKGANLLIADNNGITPLNYACNSGHLNIVELLLDRGADPNVQGGYYGTALQAACYGGYQEIVQTLLNNGADPHAQGGYYGTALQAAAYSGHQNILEILIDNYEVDSMAIDCYERTPLHLAARGDQVQCFSYLLEQRMRLDQSDCTLYPAFHYACSGGSLKIIQKILLLDPTAFKTSQTWSPLHWACRSGNKDLIQYLLQIGCQVSTI